MAKIVWKVGKMSEFRLKLVDVALEGFESERAKQLDGEIRNLISLFIEQDLDLIQDVLFSVVVTDRMEMHVDRIRRDQGAAQITPYSRQRTEVVAMGIILAAPESPPARVTIILDSSIWLLDNDENIVLRVHMLGHEIGHVIQKGKSTLADWARWKSWSPADPREFYKAAANCRDEYDADIVAGTVCKLLLSNQAGSTIDLANAFGFPFIDAARALCSRLCNFANDVEDYRFKPFGSDELRSSGLNELRRISLVLLNEFNVVLTHATAAFATANKIELMLSELKKSPGFCAYIEKDWKNFLSGLSNTDQNQGEQILVQVWEAILARLGLRFEDKPMGEYLHVTRPAFLQPRVTNRLPI